MIKIKRLFLIASFIALSVILLSPQRSTAQSIPTRVKAVYEATQLATEVPLRVPSLIPLASPAAPAEYWASSIAPNSKRYIISFDRAEDCENVEECSFASVKGELASESTTSFQRLLTNPRNETTALSDGTPAVFSPSREGIYTPASIYVQEGDYLYTFRIYMSDKADVLEMAESAFQTQRE